MGDSNGTIIRQAYEDFAQGNIPAVFAAMDPAITWHVPGHGPLSGDYTGHAQVGRFFQHTMDLSGGAFSIDVHSVLGEDDLVVALVTVNATSRRAGVVPRGPRVAAEERQATAFCEYQGDEQREDRFWSTPSS